MTPTKEGIHFAGLRCTFAQTESRAKISLSRAIFAQTDLDTLSRAHIDLYATFAQRYLQIDDDAIREWQIHVNAINVDRMRGLWLRTANVAAEIDDGIRGA